MRLTSICLVTSASGNVVERSLDGSATPSESLVGEIARCLAEHNVVPTDLALLVVGMGPGSFTGLRVGMATIKGLAHAAQVPVIGVSSLAMMAATTGVGIVAPMLDARRDEVFGGIYEIFPDGGYRILVDDVAMAPHEFRKVAEAHHATLVTGHELKIRAAWGLWHAADRLQQRLFDNISALAPRYLKASEAEKNLQR